MTGGGAGSQQAPSSIRSRRGLPQKHIGQEMIFFNFPEGWVFRSLIVYIADTLLCI
jgi:hypothetical protein